MTKSAPRENEDPSARSLGLLLLGAALGLGLASLGLLESRPAVHELPPGAAAQVGDRVIRRVDYERVLAGVAGDLRSPVDDALRRRVLERMVDEELLVQRALDLGLAVVDRRIRGELTSGLIDSIVAETDGQEPSTQALERHYAEQIDFFTRPGRLRARTLYFSRSRDDGDPRGPALDRAQAARTKLLAGEDLAEVEAALANPQVSPLPNALLPASKVRDYVGPSVLAALETLTPGTWSEPIEAGSGVHLATLVERGDRIIPTFEAIEELVRLDFKRRRGDEALRAYLDDLRGSTPVRMDESLFRQDPPSEGAGPAT